MSDDADAMNAAGIDPRGPRFSAGITSALLLVTLFVGLTASPRGIASFGWFAYQPLAKAVFLPGIGPLGMPLPLQLLWLRATEPAFVLLLVVAFLFAWGLAWPRTHPWNLLFRLALRPRLHPPAGLEDPRPPRFAQGVGLAVLVIGLVLHLIGVPWALVVAAALAFVAGFLNAAFGVCIGCQLYLLLKRAGLMGRTRPASP